VDRANVFNPSESIQLIAGNFSEWQVGLSLISNNNETTCALVYPTIDFNVPWWWSFCCCWIVMNFSKLTHMVEKVMHTVGKVIHILK
jgi:hypothetical protein